MLVCARCTGIYFGASAASLLFLFPVKLKAFHLKYFLIASIPLAADVIFYNTGVYAYNKIVSLFTGIVWGSVVFIFILTAIEKYFYTNE